MKIPDYLPWRATGTTLGSGGQGEVQLVTRADNPDGPKYALKVLRNSSSRQALERFRREVRVIKTMRAPSIVRVLDYAEPDANFQYYVMEYHEGAKTLDRIVFSESNPFHGKVLKCLGMFEQIVKAIGECEKHQPRVVHRDVNPKNILVLPDSTICLIDFGICQIEGGTLLTLVDENIGTRSYTSPECEAGDDRAIGVHSDIYSAAKVLWSMMTSRKAFARERPVFGDQSLEQIFPGRPETGHLARIFEKTIREDPKDRAQTTSEVLELVNDVRYVSEAGFPSLRAVRSRCPSCGLKDVDENGRIFDVFGNIPARIAPMLCRSCGFVFVRDLDVLQKNLERLEGLR